VTLVVVTKFHPAELVRELAALGVRDVGENRHQEAAAKAAELEDLGLSWHFIGQLQSNKARAVRDYASALHSLDRPSLLDALADPDAAPLDSFIQVNLTDDPGRGGVRPEDLGSFAERALGTPGVRLRGLMAVAGLGEDPAREFARVRELRDRVLLPVAPDATALSMGMSGDWREALREGATHLRIGSAITGNRPDPTYART
jgi:pyridoxal phosphate enzyme (YggS family)